jgi:hypothetical protein
MIKIIAIALFLQLGLGACLTSSDCYAGQALVDDDCVPIPDAGSPAGQTPGPSDGGTDGGGQS